jgi:hypothetical protein
MEKKNCMILENIGYYPGVLIEADRVLKFLKGKDIESIVRHPDFFAVLVAAFPGKPGASDELFLLEISDYLWDSGVRELKETDIEYTWNNTTPGFEYTISLAGIPKNISDKLRENIEAWEYLKADVR